MSELFFIADTHFGHAKIITFSAEWRVDPRGEPFGSIEEHDEALVASWNARVGKRDNVWILGDLAWSQERALWALERLAGRKRLLLGDHDNRWFTPHLARRFDTIAGCEPLGQGTVLTHMPIAFDGFKYQRNIHGHMHGYKMTDPDAPAREHPAYANVGVEQIGLAPISRDELFARKGWA